MPVPPCPALRSLSVEAGIAELWEGMWQGAEALAEYPHLRRAWTAHRVAEQLGIDVEAVSCHMGTVQEKHRPGAEAPGRW